MRTIQILLVTLLFSALAFGQKSVSEVELRQKTDSILNEANTLYRYESAAWVTTDLAMEESDIKEDFGGYLVMNSGDTIKSIVKSKKTGRKIYCVSFTKDPRKPVLVEKFDRDLTSLEVKLWTIKDEITQKVFTPEYKVGLYQGYNPVLELIPSENGYKFYILFGTSQRGFIPFGNDYVFFTNNEGKIINWRKFHSRIIETVTSFNGSPVAAVVHSHLPSEPYISATDICTFRLYAPIYGINTFKVVSTTLPVVFEYNIKSNSINWQFINR
jgi:hypothetical protein